MCFVRSLITILVIESFCQHIAIGQLTANFFREDYKYIPDTESFYKIPSVFHTWHDARKICALEGATLFIPENEQEVEAVTRFWNETKPNYNWIYVGISSLLNKGVFETIDGRAITDIYSNWGPGEPNNRNKEEECVILRLDGTYNDDGCNKDFPFLCKKSQASLQWNILCDMPDLSYVYNEEQGKCYKFHLTPKNWTDAADTCTAEQSYLGIINSKEESELFARITREAPKDKFRGDFLSGAVHLGFRKLGGEGWRTLKGQSFEDSGFSTWGGGQPDGADRETCGSMFYNGELNDMTCYTKCFFICEHDINVGFNLDERIN